MGWTTGIEHVPQPPPLLGFLKNQALKNPPDNYMGIYCPIRRHSVDTLPAVKA